MTKFRLKYGSNELIEIIIAMWVNLIIFAFSISFNNCKGQVSSQRKILHSPLRSRVTLKPRSKISPPLPDITSEIYSGFSEFWSSNGNLFRITVVERRLGINLKKSS